MLQQLEQAQSQQRMASSVGVHPGQMPTVNQNKVRSPLNDPAILDAALSHPKIPRISHILLVYLSISIQFQHLVFY